MICHRGASAYAPENTLASFQQAYDRGGRWVEFDVMLTKDDVAIVMHDETLDRTTNGTGNVADKTYDEILALDAGSWFGAEFLGQKIPTLVEALQLLNDLEMNMEVEIKPTAGRGVETAQITYELLDDYWPMLARPPLMSSWDPVALEEITRLDPDLVVGSVIDTLEEVDAATGIVVSVNHNLLDSNMMQRLKSQFELVLPYTVNDQHRARELLDMGADAIFTDYPDLLQ